MINGRRTVAVTFPVRPEDGEAFNRSLGGDASALFVSDMGDEARAEALREAEVLVSWQWGAEVRADERGELERARFLQLISAGVDGVPFAQIPGHIAVAGNVGAYAEPMAEHVMAMVLALAKRLPELHARMAAGKFGQFSFTRTLAGSVCAVLGYGGIGRAVARHMRAFGARIHALNTSGRTDDPVEFVGTLEDLDAVLSAADVLVVTLPLTRRTRGLIGERELRLMKPDAILANVARAAIVEEAALFEHLTANPGFMAALDVWWSEPIGQGEFRTGFPFFQLPNVLGSPHNSGLVPGSIQHAAERAGENVRRFLRGEPVQGLVRREDYKA
jgi:phosphoglycerate dehydrogenase-like enzyme